MGYTLGMASGANVHETPAMLQFRRFKQQHPDCVLFFRVGDFYETFYDDAKLAHKVLGVTLTQRTEGIPMAGVPYHSVDGYIRRMIQAGHRVAVCDQVEDSSLAKGLVRREVTRVITPGTLTDETLLDESRENPLAAVVFHPTIEARGRSAAEETGAVQSTAGQVSVAWAELSTGLFRIMTLPAEEALDELARINPRELLYVQLLDSRVPGQVQAMAESLGCPAVGRPQWQFRLREAVEVLCKHFQVATLEGFGLSHGNPAIGAASGVLHYLLETQTPGGPGTAGSVPGGDERVQERAAAQPAGRRLLTHLQPPREVHRQDHMVIDLASLRSLEVERTIRSGETEGSLLGVLQRCVTAMGKRALRTWLCYPLCDIPAIEKRQRVVGAMVDDDVLLERLTATLDRIQDVQRIASRIAVGRAGPRDLVRLGTSVSEANELRGLLVDRPMFSEIAGLLEGVAGGLAGLSGKIAQACVDSPPAHLREGGLIRDGYDGLLDELRGLQRDSSAWLAQYQRRLIDETGITNLKVGFNKVFGYYIELTAATRGRAPDSWTRKQTLKNAERFITPALKEYEDKVLSATERAIAREQELFVQLCGLAQDQLPNLAVFAGVVAELDVLGCFAYHARHHRYVRPVVVEEPVLEIRGGRHPVLDRLLGDRFVPNDVHLGEADGGGDGEGGGELSESGAGGDTGGHSDVMNRGKSGTLALITGPNMAGKSTYIRQAALITLLAHTGSFVPAESAEIGLCDRIFTRIGASDELHAGRSTFMVEMIETAHICHHAGPGSLVILDEIGRGTSTLDGLALAWAIAEHLAGSRTRTLFATHYHELTALAEALPNVVNLNVLVREWQEQIVFLHHIVPGAADRSYGIQVAKIAGLPQGVIARAKELMGQLEVSHPGSPGTPGSPGSPAPGSAPERGIGLTGAPVGDRIRAKASSGGRALEGGGQLSLFTEYLEHPVMGLLRKVELDHLTPVQAFDVLRKLKEEVNL